MAEPAETGERKANSGVLRMLRTVHAWCGVVLAVFVAVVALTGAASGFRAQLLASTLPAATSPAAPAVTFGPALEAYRTTDPTPIAIVLFNLNGGGVHTLFLRDGRRVFIDPAGQAMAPRPGIDWDAWVHQFHASLLAGAGGHQAVGVIGVLATEMALCGLTVWLTGRPRFPSWPRSARRADLLAVHRDWSGVLSLFILVEVATGAALVYDAPLREALHVAPPPRPQITTADRPPDWLAIVDGVRRRYPSARIDQVVSPGEAQRPYEVGIAQAGAAGATTVHVSPDGVVLAAVDSRSLSRGARFMNFVGSLHSGVPLGPLAKPFVAVTGVGLALISVVGAWAFLSRYRRRYPPQRQAM